MIKKKKTLPYGQCLSTIFEYFDNELTNTDRTPYSKHLEMDHKTLIKMKFVLNEECAWVAREKMRVHIEKEYEEEQEQPAGGDDEFVDMFATPPTVSSLEDVGTISW